MDGVIVNSTQYHYLTWKKIAKQLDVVFTEKDNEQLKGITRIEALKKIVSWSGTEISTNDFNELMRAKNDYFSIYIESLSEKDLLPGVKNALDFLQLHKIKIGLGSSSRNAVPILEKLNLISYFQVIVDGTTTLNSKPDPEVFLKGCDALTVSPEQTVVFEDSTAGITAAKKAGMTAVALGDASLFKQADFCYPDFTAIDSRTLSALFSTTYPS